MYAAAGGASLASRKARQTKQKKTQLAQEKAAKAKANSGIATPTRVQQSRQFHQLPATYLRTPGGPARKLSAVSYAQHNKYLLPIHEGNSGQHSHSHSHHHHTHHLNTPGHHYQQQQQQQQQQQPHQHQLQHQLRHHDIHTRPTTPRLVHRHDGEGGVIVHSHLTKSATATLPLVSQIDISPPTTPPPLISVDCDKLLPPSIGRGSLGSADLSALHHKSNTLHALPIPQDSIIVTPATPIASPGHSPKGCIPKNHLSGGQSSELVTADRKDFFGPGPFGPSPLERKCSFYRVKRSDAFEHYDNVDDDNQSVFIPPGHELTTAQLHHYRDYTDDSNLIPTSPLPNGGNTAGHKWAQCAYCEEGICICEHIECAQGKAAWLERGRRCSVQDNNPASCNKKWVQDSSLAGSSDDEDLLGVLRGPSSFANAFLYVGLGTVAIGLVIAFVGTGEKGFKTVELRLIGPSLIGIGLICCILRICFCICPSHCISSSRRARKKNSNKVDADHTTSLLRGESKRVSIAKGPQKFPITRKRSNNKMLNEGMEALRQIATTSLFLQNEQKPSTTSNRIVPIIQEPGKQSDSQLEMKKLDTTLNISDITDDEDDDDDVGAAAGPFITTAATTSTYNNNNNNNNNSNNINGNRTQQTNSLVRTSSKLGRQRFAINHQLQPDDELSLNDDLDSDSLLMETSLMIINPTPPTTPHQSTALGTRIDNQIDRTTAITVPAASSSLTATAATGAASQSMINSKTNSDNIKISNSTTILQPSRLIPSTSNLLGQKQSNAATAVPSTTLLSPRSKYDLPPAVPHQFNQQQVSSIQHTPGQIVDLMTTTTTLTTTTNTSNTTNIDNTKLIGQQQQHHDDLSQLILTPLLLPGNNGGSSGYAIGGLASGSTGLTSTINSTSSSSSNNNNNNNFNIINNSNNNNSYLNINPGPSTSSAIAGFNLNPPPSLTTLKSEPELVLSPAKLGQ